MPVRFQGEGNAPPWFGCAFGCFGWFFAIVSACMMLLPQWLAESEAAAAGEWVETPCSIVRAKVASRSDGEGGTSRYLDVEYTYEFEGESYTSDRYDFSPSMGVSGIGSATRMMRDRARRLRKQKRPVCWVDPDDPASAVLERTAESLLPWWFPTIFILAGSLFGVIGTAIWWHARKKRRLAEPDDFLDVR